MIHSRFRHFAPLFYSLFICAYSFAAPQGAPFTTDPQTWSDSEISSFLFLAQLQKKTGLGPDGDLCLEVQPAEKASPGEIRVISKSGLFDTGKCELKGGYNQAMDQLKSISQSVSNFKDALAQQDSNSAQSNSHVSAEVIGRTDGQTISGKPNCSLDDKNKPYGDNKTLGANRADYLSNQLNLKSMFNDVKSTSLPSETELKNDKDLQNCQVWRTAELRFKFESGSIVQKKVGAWDVGARKTSPALQKLLQIEAARSAYRQYRTEFLKQIKDPNSSIRTQLCSKLVATLGNRFKSSLFKSTGMEGEPTCTAGAISQNASCKYVCGYPSKSGQISEPTEVEVPIALGGAGFDFSRLSIQSKDQMLTQASIATSFRTTLASQLNSNPPEVSSIFKDLRKNAILNGNPDCSDLAGADQFMKDVLTSNAVRDLNFLKNIDSELTLKDLNSAPYNDDDNLLVVTTKRIAGGGASTTPLNCFPIKKAMTAVFSESQCSGGSQFSEARFPYKDATFTCTMCGSGMCSLNHNGTFSYRARENKDGPYVASLPHNHATDSPTYSSLLGPALHEIKDCPDCLCDNKADKLAMSIPINHADQSDILAGNHHSNSCYCSTPVAAACGIAPGGSAEISKPPTTNSSTFYFDLCDGASGGFKKVDLSTNLKSAIQSFVSKDCNGRSPPQTGEQPQTQRTVASCSTPETFEQIRARVLKMTCKVQNFPAPTNNPVADCKESKSIFSSSR